MWRSRQQRGSSAARVRRALHVPEVVLVDVHRAFAREQVERRQLQVVDRPRPASSSGGTPRCSARRSRRARKRRDERPAASNPRPAASSASTVSPSPARAAAPTGAYCSRRRSCALADHGISSQSSSSQSVSSSSKSPAPAAASRTRVRTCRLEIVVGRSGVRCACSSPEPSSLTPKRARAASSSAADDDDRARAHVLLLADHARDALLAVVARTPPPDARAVRAGRSSPTATSSAAGRSSHFGLAAKRLITSSAAIAFSSRIVTVRCSRVVDDPLAEHVVDVEQLVVALLRGQRRRLLVLREERLDRLGVGALLPARTRAPSPGSAAP